MLTFLNPGFHISQFIGDLLSGIAEEENGFYPSLTTNNTTTRTSPMIYENQA